MNELVISKSDEGLRIAILQDKAIVELHQEKVTDEFAVGDLVLGKVHKVVGGLNAAFVDVGHPKDAFLHYFDLGPQIRTMLKFLKAARSGRGDQKDLTNQIAALPDIDKNGKMEDVLKIGQEVLVQVVKEPISTKGPRLSSEISLPGQYVVLVPFSNVVSISKKIRSAEERRRLKVLADSLVPPNFGIIVRTAAVGKDAASLGGDIEEIHQRWLAMSANLMRAQAPAKVLSEGGRTTSILRDMLSMGFDAVTTDDNRAYREIEEYLQSHQADLLKNLKLYKGRVPLFQFMGIEKQIKASFGKVVTMNNGAYLVIEHTEAMHVIDVNSGSKNLSNKTLEETALRVNTEAATEIARQLRLRDLGGIVVVDFIDMKKPENRKEFNEILRLAMKNDRAKHSILPISKFGLVQITRQRVRPQLDIATAEVCPTCHGSGKIQPSILLSDEIANNVEFLIRQNRETKLSILVNPYVEAYLRKGLWKSFQFKWFRKYGIWIRIQADPSLPFTAAKYFNSKGEEIKL